MLAAARPRSPVLSSKLPEPSSHYRLLPVPLRDNRAADQLLKSGAGRADVLWLAAESVHLTDIKNNPFTNQLTGDNEPHRDWFDRFDEVCQPCRSTLYGPRIVGSRHLPYIGQRSSDLVQSASHKTRHEHSILLQRNYPQFASKVHSSKILQHALYTRRSLSLPPEHPWLSGPCPEQWDR